MMKTRNTSSRSASQGRRRWRRLRCALGLLFVAATFGSACSDDETDEPGECIGGDGAVAGINDDHCLDASGEQIANVIGACSTSAADGGDDPEHEEEEHPILFGREADDDNCKYHVRFENTCVAVGQPVTFTLSLTRLFDDAPATGTVPSNLEIFLADDLGHISPSNDITATEGRSGTYAIGPVVFDRSGRWVVRFHYFDSCREEPADSPHSHVAFYIDVP